MGRDDAERAAGDVDEVARARGRMRERPAGADRWSALVLGGGLLVLALAAALLLPGGRTADPLAFVLLVALHAIASRVELEVGPGTAVATQLALVPMLFLLPPAVVPLAVVLGLLAGGVTDQLLRDAYRDRLLVLCAFGWHAVGPALVLGLADVDAPSRAVLPVLVLALAAQLALDAAAAILRDVVALRAPLRPVLQALALAWSIDLLLTPLALAAVLAGGGLAGTLALVVAPLALVALLASGRRRALDRAVVLGSAYTAAAARARLDALTGLGNRLAWQEALEAAAGTPAFVVVADVDRLKRANDEHGHLFGDRLLCEVADLLRGTLPRAACLARIGGDEFAALLTGAAADDGPAAVAALAALLDGARVLDGFPVGAAVGGAGCPPEDDLEAAVVAADAAAYAVKGARGGAADAARLALGRAPFTPAPAR